MPDGKKKQSFFMLWEMMIITHMEMIFTPMPKEYLMISRLRRSHRRQMFLPHVLVTSDQQEVEIKKRSSTGSQIT